MPTFHKENKEKEKRLQELNKNKNKTPKPQELTESSPVREIALIAYARKSKRACPLLLVASSSKSSDSFRIADGSKRNKQVKR